MSHEDLEDALWTAEGMAYGRPRSAAMETLLGRVPDDAVDLAFRVRMALVNSYQHGAEPVKSLVPFSWCVAAYDEHPELATYAHTFFWMFKYVPTALLAQPAIPLEHTMAVLDDMERRYRDRGHSMHPVHSLRCRVAQHVGDVEEAATQFAAWWSAPRGPLSDCIGCDPSDKVDYLVAVGEDERAVREAESVLDGRLTCVEQPQTILTALLPALVRTDRLERAASAHRQAYRILRGNARDLKALSQHAAFCVRTGNDGRALEIVLGSRHLLGDSPSPQATMEFLAAGATVLRRTAERDRELEVDGTPAATVAEDWEQRALAIATQFDDRNGTSRQSDLVRETLRAEPWTEDVPLSPAERRPRPVSPPAEAEQVEEPAPDPVAQVPVAELLDQAERATEQGDPRRAVDLYVAFAERAERASWSALDTARSLDGEALRLDLEGSLVESRALLLEAAASHESNGDARRATLARARAARTSLELGEVEEALEVGHAAMVEVATGDTPAAPYWRFDLARLELAAGRTEEALSALDSIDVELDGQLVIPVAWLTGRIHLSAGRPEAALPHLVAALDAGHADQTHPGLLWDAGRARMGSGDAAGAVSELVEASVRAAELGEVPVGLEIELVEAYLSAGRPNEAAHAGEACVDRAAEVAGAHAEMEVRDLLVSAHRDLGDPRRSLVHADRLVELAGEEAAHRARALELRGWVLVDLDRADDAIADLVAAASSQSDAVGRARLLGGAARVSTDVARAASLRDEAEAALDTVDAAGPEHHYFRATIRLDRASALGEQEREPAAVEAAAALAVFRELGAGDRAADAAVVLLDVGGHDLDDAIAIWHELEPLTRGWHVLGYALVDRLGEAGRVEDAGRIEARLDETAS